MARLGGNVTPADVAADDHLDVEYAEVQPLAPKSMLLDVTRLGQRLVAVGERAQHHVACRAAGAQGQQGGEGDPQGAQRRRDGSGGPVRVHRAVTGGRGQGVHERSPG